MHRQNQSPNQHHSYQTTTNTAIKPPFQPQSIVTTKPTNKIKNQTHRKKKKSNNITTTIAISRGEEIEIGERGGES